MCEEESEDHEAVAKLLEINDSINRTIERYKLIKKGDLEGASKIPKGTLGTSGAGVSTGPDNEISLIDLGGPGDELTNNNNADPAVSTHDSKSNALEDDLLGLNIGGSTYGTGGGISLGNDVPTGILVNTISDSSSVLTIRRAFHPKLKPCTHVFEPSEFADF